MWHGSWLRHAVNIKGQHGTDIRPMVVSYMFLFTSFLIPGVYCDSQGKPAMGPGMNVKILPKKSHATLANASHVF